MQHVTSGIGMLAVTSATDSEKQAVDVENLRLAKNDAKGCSKSEPVKDEQGRLF